LKRSGGDAQRSGPVCTRTEIAHADVGITAHEMQSLAHQRSSSSTIARAMHMRSRMTDALRDLAKDNRVAYSGSTARHSRLLSLH